MSRYATGTLSGTRFGMLSRTGWAGVAADLRAGAAAMAPMLVAYLPFGLLVGAAVAASDNPVAAYAATWTIYGGAAHLATLDVLAHGSGWVAAAAVGLLINVRLSAYATAMAPDWRGVSRWRRVLAAAVLTDAPWALARAHAVGAADGTAAVAARRRFYLGAAGLLWLGWPTLVTLGVLAGGWVAALPVAGLLSAMTLGAIVVPQLRERATAVAVAVAVVLAVLTAALPAGPALLLVGVAGGVAGALTSRRATS